MRLYRGSWIKHKDLAKAKAEYEIFGSHMF